MAIQRQRRLWVHLWTLWRVTVLWRVLRWILVGMLLGIMEGVHHLYAMMDGRRRSLVRHGVVTGHRGTLDGNVYNITHLSVMFKRSLTKEHQVLDLLYPHSHNLCDGFVYSVNTTSGTRGYRTTQLPSRAVHARVVTEWPRHACVSYSPGDFKGVTEENPGCKTFPINFRAASPTPGNYIRLPRASGSYPGGYGYNRPLPTSITKHSKVWTVYIVIEMYCTSPGCLPTEMGHITWLSLLLPSWYPIVLPTSLILT